MTINAAWHRRHRMPARATLEQRVGWHLEPQRHCACRPIPEGLQQAITAMASCRAASRDRRVTRRKRVKRSLHSG